MKLIIYKNSNIVKLERTPVSIMYIIVDTLYLPHNSPSILTIQNKETIEHILTSCYNDCIIKPSIIMSFNLPSPVKFFNRLSLTIGSIELLQIHKDQL